jgi:hypothetical protein
VWWKPDYPIERFGFEPHISVYRGGDAAFADAIAEFLERQRITLNCAEYRLVWHDTRQPNLFAPSDVAVGDMILLMEATRVDPEVLDRLSTFVDDYRSRRVRRVAGERRRK